MRQRWEATGRFLLWISGVSACICAAGAAPSIVREPQSVDAGARVTLRAEGFAAPALVRWRWNERLRAERVDGALVVLVATGAGEGVAVATGRRGTQEEQAECRFEIGGKGSVGGAPAKPAPAGGESHGAGASADRPAADMSVEKHGNGKKAAEGPMKDGEREGLWTFWNEEGAKVGEGTYRAGKRHGASKQWNEKGQLVREGEFEDGRDVRITETMWNDDGTKWREETVIRRGDAKTTELVEWGYHEKGKLMGEKRFLDGKRHGEWKVWDEAGKLAMSAAFTNGWALPPAEAVAEPAARKAADVYLAVIALETNDFARATALAEPLDAGGREALSAIAFKALGVMDEGESAKFERLYRLVIDACPDTDRAHEAHWRLTHMYQQAFEPPAHAKIVALLEGFLARYKDSKVVSMQKYPDEMLVFSPLRSLHQSYEELGQWDKIAEYYGKAVAEKVPMKPVDHWDYAKALDKLGRKAPAIEWYEKFLKVETDKESFMVEMAQDRVKELKGQ